MSAQKEAKVIDSIVKKSGGSSLIAILQEVQSHYNHLPPQVLTLLSDKLEVPLSKLFSLATFYRSFSLEPKGKHVIKVCLGTACHVKSGENLFDKARRDLDLSEEHSTTADLRFTVEKVRCLGCCSLAPVVCINEETYGSLTQEKLSKVLKKYR
jgi:NADH-quinone oxidoreductase subunit E